MNWISKIKQLLGRFWSVVFASQDFLSGMESTMALSCRVQQAGHDEWVAGSIYDSDDRYPDSLPFIVYIPVDSVGRPGVSYADAINGVAELGASEQGGYAARSLYPIPHPVSLADHVSGYTVTLLDRFDYTCDGQQFLFHVDLASLNLPVVALTDEEGNVQPNYRLFGWAALSEPVHDAVVAFHGGSLNHVSEAVWDMHQRGATNYNVKKLLAGITGSVVCDKGGVIDDIWTEQNLRCMYIAGKAYSAPATAPVGLDSEGNTLAVGMNVEAGQILFGDLKVYNSRQAIPATAIPGLHVMTDAGEMVAPNQTVSTPYGVGLDLEGDNLAAYREICQQYEDDPRCPAVAVPASYNPMMFVMQRMRKGRAVAISLVARNLQAVSDAIACIRRCSSAAGMVNAYVQAEGDTLSVNASFTASAGMAAVATVATITIKEMFAEAELSL